MNLDDPAVDSDATDTSAHTGPADLLDQPLVWIDLEMTGLDPMVDTIVEIAVIITDGALTTVIEGPDIVIGASEVVLGEMHPIVKEMHRKSGLWKAVKNSSVTLEAAEREVLEFVTDHLPNAGVAPLAGNSVHADRAFMARYMPTLERHFHYRNVDVSTVKELARRWNPELVDGAPKKAGDHRALADIRESIKELAYYRDAFFVTESSE